MNNPVHGKHKYEHIRHARLQFFIIRRRLRNQKLFACVIFNSQLGSQDFEQIYQMVSVVFPLVMAVQNTTKDNCAQRRTIHVKFNVLRIHLKVSSFHHRYCETPASYITDFLDYFSKKKTLLIPFRYSHENSPSLLFNVTNIETFVFICGATAPQWARASSFTRYLDHTQRRTKIGRTPLDE